MNLSVSPEEHALRDLFPGWTPCRALTEDEMIRPESPHTMAMGGFPRSAPPKLIIPVVPTDWTSDWPDPAPLAATGVPSGWWWMPEDPKWFGAWIVLGKGKPGRGHHFFTMVTTPLRAVDYGSFDRVQAIQGIHAGLRDRVAKQRGVDPADLDRASARVQTTSGHPSPLRDARLRARQLAKQDRLEEANDLLTAALDEDGGTTRERAMGFMVLGHVRGQVGDFGAAVKAFEAARPLAMSAGLTDFVTVVDEELPGFRSAAAEISPAMRLAIRARSSLDGGYPSRAVLHARRGLELIEQADADSELMLRRTLAKALVSKGEMAAAVAEVERGVELARRIGDEDAAERLRAVVPAVRP